MKAQNRDPEHENCRLCEHSASLFYQSKVTKYYKCPNCSGIFAGTAFLPSADMEEKRYQAHNNNTKDPRYRKFVSPITEAVTASFDTSHEGLDFGCGTGPVITEVLKEKDYKITTFDPFFDDRPEVLEQHYDFIACCEVAEHFHQPRKEFKLLRQLLRKKGTLFIMTDLYKEDVLFADWYYKNDPTHVFFYQKATFHWICQHYNFNAYEISGRLITLKNK